MGSITQHYLIKIMFSAFKENWCFQQEASKVLKSKLLSTRRRILYLGLVVLLTVVMTAVCSIEVDVLVRRRTVATGFSFLHKTWNLKWLRKDQHNSNKTGMSSNILKCKAFIVICFRTFRSRNHGRVFQRSESDCVPSVPDISQVFLTRHCC